MRVGRVFFVLAFALVPAVWVPTFFVPRGATRSAPQPSPEAEPTPAPAAVSEEADVFADSAGIGLEAPAAEIRAIAYHEASRAGAFALRPYGRCGRCRHPRFEPPADDGSGRIYHVMPSRGRRSAPTSAVDVVVDPEERVLAPVSGRVREVRVYRLYGRYRDIRVAIVPDGAPRLEVVLLHLRGVRLERGDRVVASETPLGRARGLPFSSQVDRYVRGKPPHVHIEVVDAQTRREERKNERRAGRDGPG